MCSLAALGAAARRIGARRRRGEVGTLFAQQVHLSRLVVGVGVVAGTDRLLSSLCPVAAVGPAFLIARSWFEMEARVDIPNLAAHVLPGLRLLGRRLGLDNLHPTTSA